MTRWWPYVERTIGKQTRQSVARKSGFDQSAFNRWETGTKPDAVFVVKFARGNGLNILDALAVAGYITDDEAKTHAVPAELSSVSSMDLIRELMHRLDSSNDHNHVE